MADSNMNEHPEADPPGDPHKVPFFEKKPEKYTIEIPASQSRPVSETLPSGLDPMQQIAIDGRVYRSIADGKASWWIIISSWLVFAIPSVLWFFFILVKTVPAILNTMSQPSGTQWSRLFAVTLVSLLQLIFPTLILYVVSKGTLTKLRKNRHRQ